jgi:SAM-dependent methyltransferase
MTQGNIHYKTEAIGQFYKTHRTSWDQFYKSEKIVFSRLSLGASTRVLDIGCGCGGLGLALKERYGLTDYTGVDINPQAIHAAAEMNPDGRFMAMDILDVSGEEIPEENFDLVVSLSCIDWNVEFDQMLMKAYRHVRPGGYFLASFRLTDGAGISDFTRSYQFINFDGKREGEKAPYVVINGHDLLMRLMALQPSEILGYGHWVSPAPPQSPRRSASRSWLCAKLRVRHVKSRLSFRKISSYRWWCPLDTQSFAGNRWLTVPI